MNLSTGNSNRERGRDRAAFSVDLIRHQHNESASSIMYMDQYFQREPGMLVEAPQQLQRPAPRPQYEQPVQPAQPVQETTPIYDNLVTETTTVELSAEEAARREVMRLHAESPKSEAADFPSELLDNNRAA